MIQSLMCYLHGASSESFVHRTLSFPDGDRHRYPDASITSSALVPTHVSSNHSVVGMARSPSPSANGGPIRWSDFGNAICLTPQSDEISERLAEALQQTERDRVLELLKDFDDDIIREGVDLMIAGMLQHSSQTQMHARTLQNIITLLVSSRQMRFTHNHRFRALLGYPMDNSDEQRLVQRKETDRERVVRVWGEGYHEALGLDERFALTKPLASLAKYSEMLNQHPHQIASYLAKYRASRLGLVLPGRKDRVTKDDVEMLNRDLKMIITNTHRRYTSLFSTKAFQEDPDAPRLGRFGKCQDGANSCKVH